VEEKPHVNINSTLHLGFFRVHLKSLTPVLCNSMLRLISLRRTLLTVAKCPVIESISAYYG